MEQATRPCWSLATARVLLTCAVLALIVTACGSDADPDPAGAEQGATSTPTEAAPSPDTDDAATEDAATEDVGAEDAGSSTETPATTSEETTTTATTGDERAAGAEDDGDAFPVTVAGATIPARPEAIVSLSSTSTEMLFAIGAGDQVTAVDSFSNYPPEAPVTDLAAFEPNIEAIAAYEPDLVIVFSDPGDLISGLEALNIPVIHHVAAASVDDAYTQMRELGIATGNGHDADAAVAEMQARIDAAVTDFDPSGIDGWPLTYYHEVDNTLYTATSSTFIGSIYNLFGLENIADPADADGSSFGFPQLSEEYIVEADPDLIFYGCADWCGTTTESIGDRPGWSELQAVEDDTLIQLDDDIISRWGPRLAEFVELIADTLESMADTSP